jgi:hypothetical protein
MEIKMEEFNLLEMLEDLVGQLQMGKCSDEEVLEVMGNIVNYMTPNPAIEEIKEIWFRIYGENLEEDYPGFIEELKYASIIKENKEA